jgi:hypothetical protein
VDGDQNVMRAEIEIKKTGDGRLLARRMDGRPLTSEDVEAARLLGKAPAATSTEMAPADPTEGEIIAVLICAHLLEAEIWFALDESFKPDPGDGRAVFYASELPFLRTKSPDTLREIHKVKLTFGGGRVRQ